MTYHKKFNKQTGVTLLISVVILAIISAITFTVANTFLVELRVARDLQSTEPVVYAAQSFLELALFKVQRALPENVDPSSNADDLDALSFASPTGAGSAVCSPLVGTVMCSSRPTDIPGSLGSGDTFNGVEAKNIGRSVTGEVPLFDVVFCAKKSTVPSPNTPDYCQDSNVYELYDPDDPFDTDSGYKRLAIKNVSGGTGNDVKAMLCPASKLNFSECRDVALGLAPQDPDPLKRVEVIDLWSTNLNPIVLPASNLSTETNYSLFLTQSGNSTSDRKVQIFSYSAFVNSSNLNDPGNVQKGLPYFAGLRVRMDGRKGDILRSYQSIIPKPY